MAQDAGPVKVFCCHRSVDKPRVEAFARRLIADGIDAFFDKFEIGPGDNYVTIVNRGLDEAAVGLIFLSSSVSDSLRSSLRSPPFSPTTGCTAPPHG